MSTPRNNNRKWYKKSQNAKKPTDISNVDLSPVQGYYGFKLYFPQEDKVDIEDLLKKLKCFQAFIERNISLFPFSSIENNKYISLDYKYLIDEEITSEWVELKNDIVNNTEYCLNCMGLAVHQAIIEDYEKSLEEGDETFKNLPTIRVRLINVEPVLQLKDLRVNYYGKLVSVKGTVIKAGSPKLLCQYMTFACNACSGTQLVKQSDGVYTPPNKCLSHSCRSISQFIPLHNSPFTRTVTWQSLKIQELIGDEEYETGRVPRTLECEFIEDLVNTCVPGDDITITGVIKVQNPSDNYGKAKQSSVFLLYLDAISVVNNKSQSQGSYGASERITFNIKDYYAIQKIHAEPHLFRFLVHSLCPNIYGQEIVKSGLLLALFGGTRGENLRGESHVLLVGDPGLGKSQMLLACSNVAPRAMKDKRGRFGAGMSSDLLQYSWVKDLLPPHRKTVTSKFIAKSGSVYVCGNTSTSSGLTVTMTRESGGEYALEAGALMLADQGCCCIDEFDKMPTQHACLLEAMEQQSISIAKAGIVCTLPTRATILAAANPAGGHYNKAKTIAENLKISSPMLSRFDLIFILLDQPNEQLDLLLSEHVLALHSGTRITSSTNSLAGSNNCNADVLPLKDRLMFQPGENIDHLPHALFRKYIAYAHRYVNPVLSEEAKTVLKEFYLQLRKQFRYGDSTPVTNRQLNSLIRLTQARAKVELREEATKEDALDVVEIMRHSLIDVFTDTSGILDTSRSQNGTGMSAKNQAIKLLRLLQQRSDIQTKSLFSQNEIKELAQNAGIDSHKFYSLLDSLNIQGYLLKKGNSNYQLVTANL